MKPTTAVLCMAYGSPESTSASDVARYFTDIRGGRQPTPEAVEHLTHRYKRIGRPPLIDVTRRQAAALAHELAIPTFVGMKHSAPRISDAVVAARELGVTQLIGLPLAPLYTQMSHKGYEDAMRAVWPGDFLFIRGFHQHPLFIAAVQTILAESLHDFQPDYILFTAHSLPERVIDDGDDYPAQLRECATLVAHGMDLPEWDIAFQSASPTGEPWHGPALSDILRSSPHKRFLVCPLGFVADHLEVLYDIDIEAQEICQQRNVSLARTRSLNDHPTFIRALAQIVTDARSMPT